MTTRCDTDVDADTRDHHVNANKKLATQESHHPLRLALSHSSPPAARQLPASCHAKTWPDLAAGSGEGGIGRRRWGVCVSPGCPHLQHTSHIPHLTHPPSSGSAPMHPLAPAPAPAPTRRPSVRRPQLCLCWLGSVLVRSCACRLLARFGLHHHLLLYLTNLIPHPPASHPRPISRHLQSYAVFSLGSYIRLAALALLLLSLS